MKPNLNDSESDPSLAGLFGLLERAANRNPDAVFLAESDRVFTYQEVHDRARSLAGWLKSQGVGHGDRMVLCCENRAEIAIAVFAVSLLGGIFVVLNPKLRPHGLEKIVRQAEPAAVLADDVTVELFQEISLPGVRLFTGDHETPSGWSSWDDAIESVAPALQCWPGIDVDPVSLVFTSGSTAEPRGVTLSHDNITFVIAAIQERLQYRPGDVVGCFLPLAFDYGLYQIFLAARAGATLYIGDPAQVGPRMPMILRKASVSVLPAVPAICAALISLFDRRPFELPDLRAVTNTGERLPLAYIDRLESMFPDLAVYPMYGLTECKRVSILLPSERRRHPDSVGRPLAGTSVFAVDEYGERLPPGETGELVVRGRHLAHGYWRAPEETALRFRKRAPEAPVELFTGDQGAVDEEGYLYFAARADDLIKHRGNRISPVEIETAACAVPGVVEAALINRPSGNCLHLFVTVSDSGPEARFIRNQLAEKLEPFKVPEMLTIEDRLPKSLNGKIDRKALSRNAETGLPSKAIHETLLEAIGG